MQLVKIHIPDRKESGRALMEMSRRRRVDCFANDIYLVPEPALALLSELAQVTELGENFSDFHGLARCKS